MTVILIYRLFPQDRRLGIRARWEDGEFVNDPTGIEDRLTNPNEYTADGILRRFSGPKYFAVKESDAPLSLSEINYPTQHGSVVNENIGEFMRQKLRLVDEYQNGLLDESDYTAEEWNEIEEYVEKYG